MMLILQIISPEIRIRVCPDPNRPKVIQPGTGGVEQIPSKGKHSTYIKEFELQAGDTFTPCLLTLSRSSTTDHRCVPRSNCDRTSYCYPDTDHASPSCGGSYGRPPRHSTSSDTSAEEISPALLGAIKQIVSAAIREQVPTLAPTPTATPSDVEAPEEEPEEVAPVPAPPTTRRLDIPSLVPQEVPAHWLARLECLQKGL
ncbi:UNVERIFIED_CONTAM: hypothetical protein Sradi_0824000 [Sesamum radiatum]|uniref:Uncharacterized protein n=1 Tax=Sesamum radiatum TaxID=300843 RepID=A0AAW2VRC0_SESRA